jgi:hypothetical protein
MNYATGDEIRTALGVLNALNALPGQVVNKCVILAMGQVIVDLHADNFGDGLRFGQLRGGDTAQPDVADESLALEISASTVTCPAMDPQQAVDDGHSTMVDDVEHIQAQVAEIVVDAVGQVLGRDGRSSRFVGRADGPQLGDDTGPTGYGCRGRR